MKLAFPCWVFFDERRLEKKKKKSVWFDETTSGLAVEWLWSRCCGASSRQLKGLHVYWRSRSGSLGSALQGRLRFLVRSRSRTTLARSWVKRQFPAIKTKEIREEKQTLMKGEMGSLMGLMRDWRMIERECLICEKRTSPVSGSSADIEGLTSTLMMTRYLQET